MHVACAIIEENGKVFAAQRSPAMSLPLKWEFPGGKIQPDELPKDCLRREIFEELGLQIKVSHALSTHTHCYHAFTVTLYPFICSIEAGELILNEHASSVWLSPEKLLSLDWAEADFPIIQTYLNRIKAALP